TLVLILSLIGLAQYFGLAFKEIPGNFILYATMANKNLLASYLLLAMPFVWYGILFFGGKGRILAMLAYLTAVLVIAMVHARTAGVTGGMLLALLAAILLLVRGNYFTIDAGVRKILLRRLAQVLGATAVPLLLAVLIYYGHTARDANLDRAITAASVGVSSVDERLQLWEKTLQMVRDHPLLGVGIGNWKLFIPAYGSEGLRSAGGAVNFVRPHNDFLWVLSESGLPALLGFLAIFFLGGYYAWRLGFPQQSAGSSNHRFAVCRRYCRLSGGLFGIFPPGAHCPLRPAFHAAGGDDCRLPSGLSAPACGISPPAGTASERTAVAPADFFLLGGISAHPGRDRH
ncbi:MAG: O-antigen ligase family protein, partial [Calditrichaeota bacterium]|nr:O-antigen ligase family protein [Calditrichota bacterium]